MPIFVLMLTLTAAQPAHFHPGTGPEMATIAEDSTVAGVPVRRTGFLLARVDEPQLLQAEPAIAHVQVLAGDGHVVRIRPAPGVDEIDLANTLRERPDVTWAHPDLAMRLVRRDMPDDPFVDSQWHLENTGQHGWTPNVDINAELAWTVSTGAGGLISIIDSGVEVDHPDLRVTSGWDYIDDDADSNPNFNAGEGPHGTAAARPAPAAGDNGLGVAGVAYDADIYAIRLIGGDTDMSDIYKCFVESVDAGAWVLSNSWGFGDDCPEIPEYSVFEDAMVYAEEQGRGGLGSAIVLSAGNGNCDISNDGFQAQPQAISVAAVDGNDDREWYSSFGDHVDVAAPSGGVLTTDLTGDPGYGSFNGDDNYDGGFSGTSASAPIVSGVLALMFGANDRLTAADAREVLCETSTRMDIENGEYDDTGWSMYYGCGRADAGAAVMAVANEGPPTAPTGLTPTDQAWAERVLLQWEPTDDPDGDWVTYSVSCWIDSEDQEVTIEETTTSTMLDITDEVAVGDTVSFQIQAVDPWGPGEASETVSFTVVEWEPPTQTEPPDDDDGCAIGGADRHTPTLLLVAALLAVAGWRRRG